MTTNNGTGKPSGAIQRRGNTFMDRLKADFESWRPTLTAVLPRHLSADRIIKMALSTVMRSPDLHACTPVSIVKSVISAAEMGLEVGGFLGEAYILPFSNKKKVRDGNVWKEAKVTEAQLIPGYKGLLKLARQTGDISEVYATVVDEEEYKRGLFRVTLGTERSIEHTMLLEGRSGELFAVYAVVKFKDGSRHFEVLTKAMVEGIRGRSKAAHAGPWVTDYHAMAKKTAIKQALKTVTLSPEKPRDLAAAMALAADDAADAGEAFRSELADTIDAEGEEVREESTAPQTRADAIGARIGASPLPDDADPVTGEVP
jgi:recombination protein RecT